MCIRDSLNRKFLHAAGIDSSRVVASAKNLLEECESVARVWTGLELEKASAKEFSASAYYPMYKNSFYYSRSPDLIIQYKEDFLPSPKGGTNHGSPYAYDRQVPLIIKSEELKAGVRDRQVDIVDLAPSLASLLGVASAKDLDGESLFPE